MTIAWVIGSGGLLGSALCRVLDSGGTTLFSPNEAFCWRDPAKLHSQLVSAVQSFGQQIQTEERWEIYWAAGVGTMGSSAEVMMPETEAFAVVLQAINSQSHLKAKLGRLTLASSAGAIYAGCTQEIIHDETPAAPTTPYAHEKLKQEHLLAAWTQSNMNWTGVAARISTLYGPGNSHTKQQGLIAHIARCILQNKPTHIYVPIDTIRDYIIADDAALSIIRLLQHMNTPGFFTRIIAAGEPTTIAEIISIYKRITRRNPRVITSANQLSGVYTRRIQFRTKLAGPNERPFRTGLVIGIARVMAAERMKYINARTFDSHQL